MVSQNGGPKLGWMLDVGTGSYRRMTPIWAQPRRIIGQRVGDLWRGQDSALQFRLNALAINENRGAARED